MHPMQVSVECYSGRKADERPIRFRRLDRVYFVEEIVDQWYGPDGMFFKVRANHGTYVLRHDARSDVWTLESAHD